MPWQSDRYKQARQGSVSEYDESKASRHNRYERSNATAYCDPSKCFCSPLPFSRLVGPNKIRVLEYELRVLTTSYVGKYGEVTKENRSNHEK